MAIATGLVVRQTRQQIVSSERLIKDTERQIQQSERQHHDAFMPFLVVEPYVHPLSPSKRGEMLSTVMDNGAIFSLAATINNLGQGIALDPTVRFWFPDLDDYVTTPVKLPPIGVNGFFGTPKGSGTTRFPCILKEVLTRSPSNSRLKAFGELL